MSGDLYILNLPAIVTKEDLFDNLGTITTILGTLYLINCPVITSLLFLKNIVSLQGAHLINNLNLVDSRIPPLAQLTNPVVVKGCDRLCPQRYLTTTNITADDSGCPSTIVSFLLIIQGTITSVDLQLVDTIFARVFNNITSNAVCQSFTFPPVFAHTTLLVGRKRHDHID